MPESSDSALVYVFFVVLSTEIQIHRSKVNSKHTFITTLVHIHKCLGYFDKFKTIFFKEGKELVVVSFAP